MGQPACRFNYTIRKPLIRSEIGSVFDPHQRLLLLTIWQQAILRVGGLKKVRERYSWKVRQTGYEQLVYRFDKPRPDGRTELRLTPLELLDRLAA
jgi:hypothetical protein